MSTDLKLEIQSTDSDHTVQLGKVIGGVLRGGEVIQLVSDLGGGKTTLTRGIAAGAGSTDAVGSPTFTISKQYKTPNFVIKHFDFYRLQEPGLVRHELEEAVDDASDVILVEWADIVQDALPGRTIVITLHHSGEDSRNITVECPNEYGYIIEAIKHDISY